MSNVNAFKRIDGKGIIFYNNEKNIEHTITWGLIEARYISYEELTRTPHEEMINIANDIILDYTHNYHGEG